MRWQATAYDEWGYEVWDEVIDASDDIDEARLEAEREYRAHVTGAYEPGHYKAAALLEAKIRFEVRAL